MRITQIEIYGYDLHYVHGDYVMSGGRVVRALPSTVVKVTTDQGIAGWSEVCPLGQTYLPGFSGGARAALRGHAYAKSPVDVACWDVLGKATGLPVATLLGGQRQDRYPLYVAVPLGNVQEMAAFVQAHRAEDIHRFQLKIGGDPHQDAARLLDPLPRVYLEQPCPTLEECVAVRKVTTLPMIYDEIVTDVPSLLAAVQQGGAGGINLKISRVGGLTKARLIRDLCEALGVSLTIEDTWGGDLVTAAVSHLAASVRPEALFTVSFMNDWTKEHIAGYRPRSRDGWGGPTSGPGLGVEVDIRTLGEPLYVAR
ncbi:MAG: mandelate racemase [Armatimonadetes bacterium]|nr:mandelate racemase [Armatimonadota bacterium]